MTEFLEVAGRRYACDLRGTGPGVVLLHAACCNRHMYDPLLEGLASRYRVLAYDQPGFGETPLPGGPVSPVDDLFGLMDAAGLTSAALIGCSFGCRVAFDAALANQGRVRALVATGPGLSGRQVPEGLQVALAEVDSALRAGDVDLANELELRIWVDGVGRGAPVDPSVRAAVGAMNRPVLQAELAGRSIDELPPPQLATENLASVTCPVLVIVGDYDQPHCVATAQMIKEQVAGAELVSLADAAHLPSLEAPREFLRLVTGFLGSP